MLDRLSIRAQLFALVLAVALPATALIGYALAERLNDAHRGAAQQLAALARDTAGRIDVVLQRRAESMARLAERPLVRALDRGRCDPLLAEFAGTQPEFVTLTLRDRQGEVLCGEQATPLPSAVVRRLPWFRDGLASDRFAVGGAFARPPAGSWVTMLTHPVRNAEGQVGGMLVVAVELLTLQRQLLPVLPEGAVVVVLDRELHYLMRTADAERWIGQPLPAAQRAQLPAQANEAFELTGVDGVTHVNAGAEVPGAGWRVYAAMPVQRVYAGYDALLRRSLAIGGVALAVAGVIAWRVARRISQPIESLVKGTAALVGGRAGLANAGGSAEVAAVADGLRRLADEREDLRDRHARLAANHAQLADAVRDVVLLIDPDGRIVEANAAATAAYGWSVDELCTMTVSDLRTPEARAASERDFRASAQRGGALFETVHQRKDGSAMPVEISSRVVEIGGRPFRQSVVRDISARRRDEALLRGQSAVLALVAQGAPLAEPLEMLVRLVEAQAPGMLASILLLDDDGLHLRHGAAPSLPRAFVEAIDGETIGPQAGSCGTAAHRREPVASADIASDPLWQRWRDAALSHGLRACWSTPILDASGRVLGTFAMYFPEPRRPDAAHQRLVDLVTQVAAIAIASARSARTQRAQLDELLQWQQAMIDREERMRELKDEADALRARLGEAPRYSGGDAP